jgi:hypothetical protein
MQLDVPSTNPSLEFSSELFGRFDIVCAVMTMSQLRTAPQTGHMALFGNIFGYLQKYPDGAIRFRTDTPVHELQFTPKTSDWERRVYGEAFEELTHDMPEPKGKMV